MAGLSIDEISDYNNRNAFTRARTSSSRTAATFLEQVSSDSGIGAVQTKGLSESYSLLAGLSSRLEMIRTNLESMYAYAERGASALNERDRDEAIGYLRSLSGGIDDIVDQTVWKDERTLDGRTLDISLSNSGSGASRTLELNSFYTSDELGLNLTQQDASSVSSIYYDYYAAYRNQDAGVVGLDLTEAMASEVDDSLEELESGAYRLEISYAGPDSSIAIKTLDGGYVNEVDGVDLSGSGQELVDLGVGVTLSIEKEQYLESVDKYDYENEGPATLYAVLDYKRVYRHELAYEDFNQFTETDLTTNYKSRLTDSSGGSLEIETVEKSGIGPDEIGFASGNYTLRVNYSGENSSVEIRDSAGRLQFLDYKVDLSGDDKVEIDTGKGVSFTIDKDAYSGDTGQMIAMFEYQAEGNNNSEFDFAEYQRKIAEAIESLDEDWEAVLIAQNEILQINNYQNLSSASVTGSGVASLLGSSMSGTASTIFGAANGTADLSAAANAIFSATGSAITAQGELSVARVI